MRRWVRLSVALIVLITLAGATYQGVATALERHRYLRPGGLVDGGGYQLHIYCVGEGTPTVVLEAAAGSMSPAWSLVQPGVARTTRVCSYDRAGLGWSEGDGRYVPERVPANLRTLLEHANQPPPFVFVGHELGAAFARLFAAQRPGEVLELVLIDDPVSGRVMPVERSMVGAWPWLARVGLLRAAGGLDTPAGEVPGPLGEAMRAFLFRPDHLTQAAREIARFSDVANAARDAALDPSIRITELTSGNGRTPAAIVAPAVVDEVRVAVEGAIRRARERTVDHHAAD
jgi:pimeloyl-ACP methyl ester carboxylesterase